MPRLRTLTPVALAAFLVLGGAAPANAAVPVGCDVTDATLNWGFKESFRAYIDGDIANGEWTTADGATYDTPTFTWSGGTGRYEPATGDGSIEFAGSVRFVGHDGLLDTTIANPVVIFRGDSAVLLLDVSGDTMEGDPVEQTAVPLVSLPTIEVVGVDAVRTVDAPSVLTADGEIAFPNYQAGEAFDPVALSMTVGKQCPVADDGGELFEPEAAGFGGIPPAVLVSALGVVIVLVAGAGVFVATRRRRA